MADPSALPPWAFDSKVPVVYFANIFCISVATVAVTARIYTRKFMIDQLGADDYLSVLALLIAIGVAVVQLNMTRYGLGHHVQLMTGPEVPIYLKNFYMSIVLYCGCLTASKMSLLCQYYRIVAAAGMRNWLITAMVLVGGWSLSQLFVGIFICSPIPGFWDSTIPSKCIPNFPQFYINAAGNIITDVIVLILPIPILYNLQLRKTQKLTLIGVFSLGFFTVAISVIRIKFLRLFEDFPWEQVESSSWSIAELCCGITCGALPTLRPLVSRFLPHLRTALSRSTRSGYDKTSDENGTGTGRSGSGIRDMESGKGGYSSNARHDSRMLSSKSTTRSAGTMRSQTGDSDFGDLYPSKMEAYEFSSLPGAAHNNSGGGGGGGSQSDDHEDLKNSLSGYRNKNVGFGTTIERDSDRAAIVPGRGIQVQREIFMTEER